EKAEVPPPETEEPETEEPETEAPAARAAPDADPLDAIAQISGHSDGEAFWNALVESVGGGPDVFAAIESAMTELRRARAEDGETLRSADEAHREAFMRLAIRDALKETEGAIAVVTGAWHVPALRSGPSFATDRAAVRGLPKLKTVATWVPW